ncbi:MAG: CBS domain-containing protein [Bdellovibrionales bacterium]|nr:CBS domain-containing protein [Bdellovibrionales bacterium]
MDIQSTVADLNLITNIAQCGPDATIAEVRELLQGSKIGSIVITERKKVKGIFTERDYLMKIAGHETKKQGLLVSEFMTQNPKSVDLDTKITDVLELMIQGRFRHVVVNDKKGELAGVVSIRDLMEFLQATINDLEKSLKDLAACIV